MLFVLAWCRTFAKKLCIKENVLRKVLFFIDALFKSFRVFTLFSFFSALLFLVVQNSQAQYTVADYNGLYQAIGSTSTTTVSITFGNDINVSGNNALTTGNNSYGYTLNGNNKTIRFDNWTNGTAFTVNSGISFNNFNLISITNLGAASIFALNNTANFYSSVNATSVNGGNVFCFNNNGKVNFAGYNIDMSNIQNGKGFLFYGTNASLEGNSDSKVTISTIKNDGYNSAFQTTIASEEVYISSGSFTIPSFSVNVTRGNSASGFWFSNSSNATVKNIYFIDISAVSNSYFNISENNRPQITFAPGVIFSDDIVDVDIRLPTTGGNSAFFADSSTVRFEGINTINVSNITGSSAFLFNNSNVTFDNISSISLKNISPIDSNSLKYSINAGPGTVSVGPDMYETRNITVNISIAGTMGGYGFGFNNSNVTFNSNVSAIEVTGVTNGAAFMVNGGQVSISNSNLNISGNSNLNTSLNYGGGAIFASNEATLQFNLNSASKLTNNTALFGGAIYLNDSAKLTLSPVSGTLTIEGNTAGFNNVSVSGLGGAVFIGGGANLTLSGNVVFKNNYRLNVATTTERVLNDIYLQGGTININSGANIQILSGIGGSGGITNSGGELQLMASAENYTGRYTQNSGKLLVSATSFNGIHNITGGEMNFLANSYLSQYAQIAVSGQGKVNIENSAVFEFGHNVLSGNGILNNSKGATLNITGNNGEFIGVYNQTSGNINLSGLFFGGVSNINAGNFNVSDGASFFSSAVINLAANSQMKFDIEGMVGVDDEIIGVNFASAINGSGSILKTGNGELIFSSRSVGFTGTYTQNSGTTTMSSGTYFSGTSYINNGLLFFDMNSNGNVQSKIQLAGPSTLEVRSGSPIDFTKGISGTGKIINNADGYTVMTISGDSSGFTGTYIQESMGILRVSSNAFNTTYAFSSSNNLGTIELATGIKLSANTKFSLNAGNTLNISMNSGQLSFGSGVVSGAGVMLKTGNADLNITGNNSGFTGNFIQTAGATNINSNYFVGISSINGGTLNFNSGSAFTSDGSESITLHSGTINVNANLQGYKGYYSQLSGTLNVKSAAFDFVHNILAGTVNIENGAIVSEKSGFSLASGSILNLNVSQSVDFAGVISGSGTINKTVNGTVKLFSDYSGFTGRYYQTAGTIAFSGTSRYFTNASSITGGTVIFQDASSTANDKGEICLYGNSIFHVNTTGDVRFASFEGDGNIIKDSTGSLRIMSNSSKFNGKYTQYAGEISFFGGLFDSTFDLIGGSVLLNDGIEFSTNTKFSIGEQASVVISGNSGSIYISSNVIAGKGTLELSGSVSVEMVGRNPDFTGKFLMNGGQVSVGSVYFTGISSITGGILTFREGSTIGTADVRVYGSGNIILDAYDFEFSANTKISGDGILTNAGSGTFKLLGGTDKFNGTYSQQNGGTTIAKTLTFGGEHEILSGNFIFDSGSVIADSATFYFKNSTATVKTNESLTFTVIEGNDNSYFHNDGGGEVTLKDSCWDFEGEYSQTGGVLKVYNKFFVGDCIINGGTVELLGTSDMWGVGKKFELTNVGTNTAKLLIKSTSTIEVDPTIIGNGLIEKHDLGTVKFLSDNKGFTGVYKQYAGGMEISSFSFNTMHEIYGGNVIFETGVQFPLDAKFTFAQGSTLTIRADKSDGRQKMIFQENFISGTGTIIKNGTIELNINHDFSKFNGHFFQEDGLTVVSASGTYFNVVSSITGGTLQFNIYNEAALPTNETQVWGKGIIQINSTNSFTLPQLFNVKGNGLISHTGSGSITLKNTIKDFTGTFQQTEGIVIVDTTVYNSFSVTGGTVLLNPNALLSTSTVFDLSHASGKLDIQTSSALNISRWALRGMGTVVKNNLSDINITGDNERFQGLYIVDSGTTNVYAKYFVGETSVTAGVLNFKTGSNLTTGIIRLYSQNSTLNMDAVNISTFSGKFAGDGIINKNGTNRWVLNGDNSEFTGKYNHHSGSLIIGANSVAVVPAKAFNTTYNINVGIIEISSGIEMSSNTKFKLADVTTMSITSAADLHFDSARMFEGDGKLIKSGNGQLYITGDNRGFTGDFLLSSGKVIVSSHYFVNTSSIVDSGILEFREGSEFEKSTLQVWNGGTLSLALDTNFTLSSTTDLSGDGILHKSGSGVLMLSGNPIKFTGSYTQSSGILYVATSAFDKTHRIEGGNVVLTSSQSVLNANTKFNLINQGTLSIWTETNKGLIFTDNVVFGNGIIINNGSGSLNILGSQNNFNGLYVQTSGTTTIAANARYFTGISSIAGGVLNFDRDSSLIGGKMQVYGGEVNFTSASVNIANSKESAFSIYSDAKISFNYSSMTFFANNAELENGAAIYCENIIQTLGSFMNFRDNRANKGGAVYVAKNSTAVFNGQGSWTGNIATANGGAIYASSGSYISISAVDGDITFKDNTIAASIKNDIFMEDKAVVSFDSRDNCSISINGGVLSSSDSFASIEKTGNGYLKLMGENQISGNLLLKEGILSVSDSGAYKIGNTYIYGNAMLDMSSNTSKASSFNSEKFIISSADSRVKLDFIPSLSTEGYYLSDTIYASTVSLNGILDINAKLGSYLDNEFEIVVSSSGIPIEGQFSTVTINSDKLKFEVSYNAENGFGELGKAIVKITGFYQSDFSKLLDLRENEKSVAQSLDAISADKSIVDTPLYYIINDTWDNAKNYGEKNILFAISPYFYANVIRSVALGYESKDIYNKKDDAWIQVIGGYRKYNADESSNFKFEDSSYGIMLGAAKTFNKIRGGAFIKVLQNSLNQGGSWSEVFNLGLGFYGGTSLVDTFDVKSLISMTINNFSVNRLLDFENENLQDGKIAFADLLAYTLTTDVEISYPLLEKAINIKPFLGIENKVVSYGNFSEKRIRPLALEFSGGSYVRNTARLGSEIGYNAGTWSFNFTYQGDLLLSGEEPSVKATLIGVNNYFEAKGFKENGLSLTMSFGIEKQLATYSKNVKFFAYANYYGGDNYETISGRIGVKYLMLPPDEKVMAGKPRGYKTKRLKKSIRKEHERVIVSEYFSRNVFQSFKRYLEELGLNNFSDKDISNVLFVRDKLRFWVKVDDSGNVQNGSYLLRILRKVAERRKELEVRRNESLYYDESEEDVPVEYKEGYDIDAMDQMLDKLQDKSPAIAEKEENYAYIEKIGVKRRRIDKFTERITLTGVDFGESSHNLNIKARNILLNIAKRSFINSDIKKIVIEAHTDDDVASTFENMLILRRSIVVTRFLENNGVPLDKIEYLNLESRFPIASNDTEKGKESNRRIEIFIEKQRDKQTTK
ncbi:MAG: hypothetical protein LBU55_03070 [Elusimicrobiota bacterium]|jgi:autotransporter-associated beta strand protein|nr:hypothetical protein [Elusimicrobiota bacterium]